MHSKSWLEEDIAANNISSGNIAKFDPLLTKKARGRKMSDLVRRWMEGR
jgi:hypothetical protein